MINDDDARSEQQLEKEDPELRERLSLLAEASLRINESLELEAVLQSVLDSARSLTNARYGVLVLVDGSGEIEEFLSSGFTPEQAGEMWQLAEGMQLFRDIGGIATPLRHPDFLSYSESLGVTMQNLPIAPVATLPFLFVPIIRRDDRAGVFYMGEKIRGSEFSRKDEETLTTFASHVALVIANARKHREEKQARNHLETLIDVSPFGVAVFDAVSGAPILINQEALRIVEGLRRGEQDPMRLLQTIGVRRGDGTRFSFAELPMAEVLRTGETIRAEDVVLEGPDGRSASVLLNATRIRTADDVVRSVIVTIQEVPPLEESERLRAEFLGMVSHELRIPLTSIRGSATSMLDSKSELDPAEERQFLRMIVDQADTMRCLIGELLDVVRVETGSLPINPEPVVVGEIVDRARNAFISAGGRHELKIELDPDLPLVTADRGRVGQVIANLLSNADRQSPETLPIKLEATAKDFQVEIAVSDDGAGIPADRLPHVFRKFSQSDTDDGGAGTGLGLAICKGIVEAHGGRIWAESEGAGRGATFTFTLPIADNATVEDESQGSIQSDDDVGGETVMVVDDDPQALGYIRRNLLDAGYVPVVTAEPREARKLLAKHRPRLILLDLMFPDSDGIGLMNELHAVEDVPVIFVSGYGKDHIVAHAFESGASDYIVKPFSPIELVARIKACLRRQKRSGQHSFREPFAMGELVIDYSERLVTVSGDPVRLTATEYAILRELSLNAGRVLTHDQLLNRIWREPGGDLPALRTHIRRLRVKIGDDDGDRKYIFAEPRVGYRMPKTIQAN